MSSAKASYLKHDIHWRSYTLRIRDEEAYMWLCVAHAIRDFANKLPENGVEDGSDPLFHAGLAGSRPCAVSSEFLGRFISPIGQQSVPRGYDRSWFLHCKVNLPLCHRRSEADA